MSFVVRDSVIKSSKIHLHQKTFDNGIFVAIFRLTDSSIDDPEWKEAVYAIKDFAEWVRTTKTHFHFVFDVHNCEQFPMFRLYEVQKVLRRRQDVIEQYCVSSVVITNSVVVEKLFSVAFNLYEPIRPLKMFVAAPHMEPTTSEDIPCSVWDRTVEYFQSELPNAFSSV